MLRIILSRKPSAATVKTTRFPRRSTLDSATVRVRFPFSPPVQGAERGKNHGCPDTVFAALSKKLFVYGIPIMQGAIPEKGFPDRMVPNFIRIFLPFTGIPGMKVKGNRFPVFDGDILRQMVVQRGLQPFRRDPAFRSDADTELPGDAPRYPFGNRPLISSFQPGYGIQRLLKNLLYGQGVLASASRDTAF